MTRKSDRGGLRPLPAGARSRFAGTGPKCEIVLGAGGEQGECGRPAIGYTLDVVPVCLDCEDDDALECMRYFNMQVAIDSKRRRLLAIEARDDRPLDACMSCEFVALILLEDGKTRAQSTSIAVQLKFERVSCRCNCRTLHINGPRPLALYRRELEFLERAQCWDVWIARSNGDAFMPVCPRCEGSSRKREYLLEHSGKKCAACGKSALTLTRFVDRMLGECCYITEQTRLASQLEDAVREVAPDMRITPKNREAIEARIVDEISKRLP